MTPGLTQQTSFPMNIAKHTDIWLMPYLRHRLGRALERPKAKRVWVTITDHFEPLGTSPSEQIAQTRVALWRDKWPRIAEDAPRDSAGQRAQYTFFYPQEEYRRELLNGLAEIVELHVGDVEVHIHHDNERRESFVRKVSEFCRRLADDHGLLRQQAGRILFGFIHGNWALDNSRPDGKWCGLIGEIALLRDLGCYADFTMPSAPSATQARIVNKIYWCTNNSDNRPRSFDRGIEASVGEGKQGDLLMITGPLGLRFGERALPRIETGEIAGYDMPTRQRVRRWFDLAPSIGDDLFLKLYSHGSAERNLGPLLNRGLGDLFKWIAEEAERRSMQYRWATAWQMYGAVNTIVSGS
jgi:hypothetical protein